jgi:integrase
VENGTRISELLTPGPADIKPKHEVITIINGKEGNERRVLVKSQTMEEVVFTQAQNSK